MFDILYRLDQSDLADDLGVNRSPVREALRMLTAEDLVTHLPHRGTIVNNFILQSTPIIRRQLAN